MPSLASSHAHPNPLASHAPTSALASMDDPQPSPSPGTPAHISPTTPTANVSQQTTRPSTPSLRPDLVRARSDFGPRHPAPSESADEASTDGHFKIRHGWDDQLNSEEYSNMLTSNFFMYYTDKKHETGGHPKSEASAFPIQEWRMRDRLKTVSAVLALCLNIGVDPPDVIKTNPCAKEECWIDPTVTSQTPGHTPMNQIGKALQTQYEQLSMRTRYKLLLDPTTEETRKYTSTLRRNARNERVLFHYNGHGVPKPTSSGEIWVFNRNYTQYIPLSLYDLQSWIGAPSLFVYDCSDAGIIISNFNRFAEKHQTEFEEARRRDSSVEYVDFSDCIHLAACREKESLPTNPELPADMFTACLTDPITMAVRFFILQNPLPSKVGLRDAHNIPGKVSERRTPIGELNWIFTAITDTIAWNSLSKPLFKKLFRQDLMVAALFRNYLLAQRIMRVYHCNPISHPEIPQTHDHPLWRSWDLAVELILAQLPDLQAEARGEKEYQYKHSEFFAEQLTAFEVYLTQGAVEQKIPEQLPIVLQVLLSQVHRLRALILLSSFLDHGPWAVNLALSIGIFPYVLKLLQSQANELKPVMVFIWARILAVDQSCQADLLKDNGYQYFINIFNPNSGIPIQNASEHRAMCAFIISMFCKDYNQGQRASLSTELVESCLDHLKDMQNPLLRQWSSLCLSKLWINYEEAKWVGIRCMAHERLCELVIDPVAEVRAAMLHALTSFLGIRDVTAQVANIEESIASMVLVMTTDGNSMVRRELLIFFSTFVARYKSRFVVAAFEQFSEETNAHLSTQAEDRNSEGLFMKPRAPGSDGSSSSSPCSQNTIYSAIWKEILVMSVDPHPEIAMDAGVVVDYILIALLDSPLAKFVQSQFDDSLKKTSVPRPVRRTQEERPAQQMASTPPTPSKESGYLSLFGGMRKSTSVGASLKSLWTGHESSNSSQKAPGKGKVDDLLASSTDSRPQTPEKYHVEEEPESRGLKSRTLGQKPEIPLKSVFFEWSVEYFREPQMKPTEADEPGSTDYNGRLWRRNRNDKIIAETQPLKDVAVSNRWDVPRGYFDNLSQPMKMCFHQFEDHLVVTDNRDTVNIIDYSKTVNRLNCFSNGNPPDSKITDVRFINEDDQALLMIGSSDGVIKIFRNYDTKAKTELVTAFRALTDLVPSNKNAGLVFDWQQGRGLVLVAGDVKVIRVWNAGTEVCTSDIPARSGSCITSLTSDQVEGDVFVAGFGDGAIRVYDQRQKPASAMVKVWKEHKQWVTNVHLQRGGQRELISGCRSGEVKLWDIRMDRSVRTIQATTDHLRTLSVHEHAPVFATGTQKHRVKIFNINNGKPVSCFEPYSGFLRDRSAPISATAFHPHRLMIAAAALHDNHVNIFSCHEPKNPTLKTVKLWEGSTTSSGRAPSFT
ncbi:WD repeat-containing protein-like protein mip1 [Dothidotthia symphoricarpi CBS 119687]|uniref:WD repeat-containing protein-like protein mip1 n=1 Tax=Dothidotthia symphoricarpi CBS 119687 TaxID=1392245 RepID=A0A6A6AM04_9PLEO|nr:WD repeat-containing protein-like protein mip1 [Dothidotthia symphoricarpi CBS 119687]KAF2131964.1 WD repeat-containing protein-like protein mip1 [Dothidotthia symphoricarpi CBS 119687]